MSTVIDKLSSTERTDLLEVLFDTNGTRQGNAVLQAFQSGQIQKAYKTSINAAGSTMQAHEKWMESLEAKTQQFGAAFQSLSNTMLDDDFLKSIIDSGTDIVSVLDTIIGKIGSLETFGLGAGLLAGVQNTGKCRMSVRIS